MAKKNTKAQVAHSDEDGFNTASEALALAKANKKAIDELKADLKRGLETLTAAINNLQQRNRLR